LEIPNKHRFVGTSFDAFKRRLDVEAMLESIRGTKQREEV